VVFVPLAQWLIIHMGWRHTLLVFAFIFLIMLVPLNLIFMRARPEDKGQLPDGRTHAIDPQIREPAIYSVENPARQEMTFRQALATPSLYFLTLARLFGTAAAYMVTIHIIAFFIDAGYSEMVAASSLALSQMVSFIGRPLSGFASDRMGREKMMTASYVLDITGMVVILGLGDGRVLWPIYIFALCHGLSSGPVGIAIGAKAADLFPGSILGSVMGVINFGRGLGLALGPFLGGLFYDRTKNYILAFSLAIGFMLLSLACFWVAHFMGKASSPARKE
jgi:MFS family permease